MPENISIPSNIDFFYSKGSGKGGKRYIYLSPRGDCGNKPRRVEAMQEKVDKVVNKWYSPSILFYKVDNRVIGSNSEENALREYWRICEKELIGVGFPVTLA